jgi:predicted ATP-dependent serine protease
MAIQFKRNTAVVVPKSYFKRAKTKITAIDGLFGGGFVGGQTLTVCGNRGAGKTQFMLQLIDACAKNGKTVGYMTCEETIEQIAYTANRIKVDVPISTFTTINEVLDAMDNMDILVLDSLSMVTITGNKRRLKFEEEAIDLLYDKAKKTNCIIFIVVHMTKNGTMKGSSYLGHKVDTNLHIETVPEDDNDLRKIYTSKNRYGQSCEIIAAMTKTGYDFDAYNEFEDNFIEEDENDDEEVKPESKKLNFILPPKTGKSKNIRKNSSGIVKFYHGVVRGLKYIDEFLSK